jgi:hypothetical protein
MGLLHAKPANLAIFSTSATVFGLAFAIRPVHASTVAFWSVIGVGVFILGIGKLPFSGPRRAIDRSSRSRRVGLAVECRRVRDALGELMLERESVRPRGLFTGDRIDRWQNETAARYRREFGPWVRRVFDEAVELEAASPTARPLVEEPPPGQLARVRDVFGEAADRLEQLDVVFRESHRHFGATGAG